MKVIALDIIEDYAAKHPDTKDQLSAWLEEAKAGGWANPIELKQRYPSASLLGGGTVIFNIKGNRYRLEVQINYEYQAIRIIRIGTHAEYDKWKK